MNDKSATQPAFPPSKAFTLWTLPKPKPRSLADFARENPEALKSETQNNRNTMNTENQNEAEQTGATPAPEKKGWFQRLKDWNNRRKERAGRALDSDAEYEPRSGHVSRGCFANLVLMSLMAGTCVAFFLVGSYISPLRRFDDRQVEIFGKAFAENSTGEPRLYMTDDQVTKLADLMADRWTDAQLKKMGEGTHVTLALDQSDYQKINAGVKDNISALIGTMKTDITAAIEAKTIGVKMTDAEKTALVTAIVEKIPAPSGGVTSSDVQTLLSSVPAQTANLMLARELEGLKVTHPEYGPIVLRLVADDREDGQNGTAGFGTARWIWQEDK